MEFSKSSLGLPGDKVFAPQIGEHVDATAHNDARKAVVPAAEPPIPDLVCIKTNIPSALMSTATMELVV